MSTNIYIYLYKCTAHNTYKIYMSSILIIYFKILMKKVCVCGGWFLNYICSCKLNSLILKIKAVT